uniref:Uncharacterized protein n=1 Tax=Hemiselmis andersenii TaxID=464988 RepID=A0A7S0Y5J2_HEMAN|mmetsp:Transcript_6693/g.15813  ORF Transcript_6693/g.15813 Transcript_6693/m.15813 type:complete len:271 (+) Transcript_6693:42-854(+)
MRTGFLLLCLLLSLCSSVALSFSLGGSTLLSNPHRPPSRSPRSRLRGGQAIGSHLEGSDAIGMASEVFRGRTVLVDMDNTIVDWDREFAARWEKSPEAEAGDSELILGRTHFEMEENFSEGPRRERAKQIMKETGFYESLQPFEGALRALEAMSAAGASVLLVTSPHPFCAGECANEKFRWVEKHLGKEWESNLIITRDKTFVAGDILVDDKPLVTGRALPTWVQVHFAKPYTKGLGGVAGRLETWSDYDLVLGGILASTTPKVTPTQKP